ncbi:MAG TPA: glucokinase [Pirellulales bacterium]|jgi:glucokinase|nr:glucokinase [Pirellulales bacterium]
MILAGDIGGTSTRLAQFEIEAGRLVPLSPPQKFPSREHTGLDEIVAAFVAAQKAVGQTQSIEHAAFGIAGPVRDGKVHTSNLPWMVDAAQLALELGISAQNVHLLNDLEANAHGIPALGPHDLVTLNAGQPDPHGNAAIISAGTGLGEAGIFFDGQRLIPFACEGGHADFAPCDQLETELLLHLKEKFMQGSFGHVSCERVLSGPGLRNIYEFLRDTGHGQESAELTAAIAAGDPSAAISKAALDGSSPLCVQAMDMFVSYYGAEAGNLALKMLATRCVYIGGGIAPRIIGKLRGPRFLEGFCNKGRMKSLMELIPIQVIVNDLTALFGAGRFAAMSAGLLPAWLG